MSAGLIFTDHSAYGVSVAAGSVPTVLSRIVAVPGAVETPAFGGAALGVEDKVPDQPQEIQAVSVCATLKYQEHSHGRTVRSMMLGSYTLAS